MTTPTPAPIDPTWGRATHPGSVTSTQKGKDTR